MIIHAIGPELTQYGITDELGNPRLELHNGTGALIATNDDWQTTIIGGIITSNQVSDIQNSGHAPTAVSESAIIANLQPGNYTAIVRGVNNTTGVALSKCTVCTSRALATYVWYTRNNLHIRLCNRPTLPAGRSLAGVADFNGRYAPRLSAVQCGHARHSDLNFG